MVKKNHLLVTFALVGLVIVLFNVPVVSLLNDSVNLDTREARVKLDKPVSIDGNDVFHREARKRGWLGNGTEQGPYILENLIIKNEPIIRGKKIIPVTAIDIRNTDLYFIITGSILTGEIALGEGIFLSNVLHATVTDNAIINQ